LFTAINNVTWPKTPVPGCFAKELRDRAFQHRGFATVEENDGGITYWEAWASANLMVCFLSGSCFSSPCVAIVIKYVTGHITIVADKFLPW
jgi:hypothetical protein